MVLPERDAWAIDPSPVDIMQEYGYSSLNVAARFDYYVHATPSLDPAELIEEKLHLAGNETILDAGCSAGKMLMGMRDKGHYGQLVGLDISEELFLGTLLRDDLQAPRPIDFLVGSVEDIPLDDSCVDVSTALFVLYHCDPVKALSELKRVTKPGGTIVISTSGANNKLEHRRFEGLIAEKLGCTPPPRFNASFDTELANYLLPQVFEPSAIEHISHKAVVDLTNRPGDPEAAQRRMSFDTSLLTMRGSMEPLPDYTDWKSALKSAWASVDAAQGSAEYFDLVERDYYFCRNDK